MSSSGDGERHVKCEVGRYTRLNAHDQLKWEEREVREEIEVGDVGKE